MGQSTTRAGLGVIAYNVGGIQTMLFTRFGFDNLARKTAESNARRMLMDAIDMNAIPDATGFQGTINYLLENRPVIQKKRNLDKSEDIFRLLKTGDTSQLPTPPLETPGINPASFDKRIMAQGTVDQTGLTSSELAFLDDEEKAMRLKERGYA